MMITTLLPAIFVSQTPFIFGVDAINLCRPIRRLFIPVIIAAFMIAILVVTSFAMLTELFETNKKNAPPVEWVFWISWIVGIIFFYIYYRQKELYSALKGILITIFLGSLVVLSIAILSNVIVSGRPCRGIGFWITCPSTKFETIVSLLVMFWSFGPGIIVYLLKAYRNKNEIIE